MQINRFEENPLIEPSMLMGRDGENINGPTVIRVPSWCTNPLGKYYLYFSHHNGDYIRLAYSNDIHGPWHIKHGGILHLNEIAFASNHIASPEIFLDHEAKKIRLYFHIGVVDESLKSSDVQGQPSIVATSSDGLFFDVQAKVIGPFYLRVFKWKGRWLGLSKGGELHESTDGMDFFKTIGNPFTNGVLGKDTNNPYYSLPGDLRHIAIDQASESSLIVYFTRIGDAPERILRSVINTSGEPSEWKASNYQEILRPEKNYEGVHLEIKASIAGAEAGHALRDPYVFYDNNKKYLFYTIQGEKGIAAAELL